MFLIFLIISAQNQGFLNVMADQDSLPVYVDNDSVGLTPLEHYALPPDEYHVGFFPQDSIEKASWRFKDGNISALWKLARYSEGIVQVRIAPDSATTVTLCYKDVENAPRNAKMKISGCLGGAFVLGVITTIALYAIF